jgi:hypothetical protein
MDGPRVNDTKQERAIIRYDQAAAALVEQAHILTTADNRVCYKIRQNTAELLLRARDYVSAVRALQRIKQ